MAKKPTTFSMRMPEDLNEKIQAYAIEHNCTKAEAMSHFARAGIELEENGGAQLAQSAQSGDADASAEALAKIQERLEALQKLPPLSPPPQPPLFPRTSATQYRRIPRSMSARSRKRLRITRG